MKDIVNQFYNGILRFFPVRKYFSFKSNHSGMFPVVGFLDFEKKKELEQALGIQILKTEYFEQALTHRSYLQILEDPSYFSNERLEFLGDSILGMIIADYLFSMHSNVLEGELTKMRSWLVNSHTLALCAGKIGLDKFIQLSFSAEKSMKSGSESIMADALEAVIAAIYLDSGLEVTRGFIINSLVPIMLQKQVMKDDNYKSILLEKVQGAGKPSPTYNVLDESGPDHQKEFRVGVFVESALIGAGTGRSKKEAEQSAAKDGLNYLKNNSEFI